MPELPARRTPAALWVASVCAATIFLYFLTATTWYSAGIRPDRAQSYYVSLAEAFRSGHLNLPIPVPAGLAQLKDPYDPNANLPYRQGPEAWLHDLSYYHGKLYTYYGPTPALLLYWPWLALTKSFLPDGFAVAFSCSVGFLVGAWLLLDIRKRQFPAVPLGLTVAGILAFGFASDLTIILQRPDICEVAISCGFALTMMALVCVWKSITSHTRSALWLGLGSLAYGLALGCRPSLAFGAAILLVPFIARRGPGSTGFGALVCAALAPIVLIGVGLLFYNFLRFDSALEFGQHYQMAGDRQDTAQHFSVRYVAFNFRLYFLSALNWSRYLPFVGPIDTPKILPAGHALIEDPYGIFLEVPVTLFALALPFLGFRAREDGLPEFPAFVGGFAALLVANASVLLLFYLNCNRYQVEFQPELILLAAIAFIAVDTRWAGRSVLRLWVRSLWIGTIVFSIAVSLMNTAYHYADTRRSRGTELGRANQFEDAVQQFQVALRVHPDDAEIERDLGDALGFDASHRPEAILHLERSIAIDPDDADTHFNLANDLLFTSGRIADAITQYEASIRLNPGHAEAHYNLGVALLNSPDRKGEALAQFQEALKLKPDSEPARQMVGRLQSKAP